MTRLRSLAGLAAVALFAAPGTSAQRLAARDVPVEYPSEPVHGGIHILTELPDGSIGCDVASETLAAALRASDERAGTVHLTVLPSLNRPGVSQFRIMIRATDQLLARPAALMAFRRAAARWERIIQTPITTMMDLDYGPNRFGTPYGANILGSTNSAQQFVAGSSSATIRDAIAARQTDPAKLALVTAIPSPTPSTVAGEAGTTPLGQAIAGLVTRQALGYAPAVTPASAGFGTVPNIGFNSAFAYDFNPQDGITSGQTDFEAVAVHEIGHALGFTSAIGGASTGNPYFTPWDLYRVRPEAVTPGESYTDGVGWEVTRRLLQPGPTLGAGQPGNHVMFVGDAEYELSTARGDRTGGDDQQASHWRADEYRTNPGAYIGIMDPTIAANDREEITEADIDALELFGYVVRRAPVTASARLSIAGDSVGIDFLSATVRKALTPAGGSLAIQIRNAGGPDALDFEISVVQDSVQAVGGAAPVVTVSPSTGSVAPGATDSASLNISAASGGAVVYGRLQIRFNDPARAFAEVPFQISLGTPLLAPVGTPSVTVASGAMMPASLDIRNGGDAPLTFVRVLEPAASDPATAFQPIDGDAVVAPGPVAVDADVPMPADEAGAAAVLAQLNVPATAATRLYDLTQMPNGDVLAVDGGTIATTTIYQAPADLSAITATYTTASSLGGQVTGLAYNARTASLWVAIQETGALREIRFEGTTIVPTGRQVGTGIAPFGLDYSPELDAFFVGEFGTGAVRAFTAAGTLLPGYPADVQARGSNATTTPGLSFTEGLLEMTSFTTRLFQAGQFGMTVPGSPSFTLPTSTYGVKRSRLDPNGTLYLTSRTGAGAASIRSLDPPDLPANVGTRLEAAAPLFSVGLLAPGATQTLPLVVDGTGLTEGSVQDELAFLTNAPGQRILRFPVTINVGPVAGEDGPTALDAVSTLPNPARGAAQVRLSLSAPSAVTVGVYNTLGQRVAVLAEGQLLAAGAHAFAFRTDALAAGVYVVRVQAGATVSTQKLTVIR